MEKVVDKKSGHLESIIIDSYQYDVEDFESYDGKNYHLVIPMKEVEKIEVEKLPKNFIIYLQDTKDYINIDYAPDIYLEYSLHKTKENISIGFFGHTFYERNSKYDLIMDNLWKVIAIHEKKKSEIRITEIVKNPQEYTIGFVTTIPIYSFLEVNQSVCDLIKILVFNAILPYSNNQFNPNIFPDEETFSKNLIIPLFRRLGFNEVKYNHGKDEFGIDILLSKTNELFLNEFWGIQVKKGKISGAANSFIDKIIAQIDDAFNMPISILDSNNPVFISKFILVTDDCFSNNAIAKINSKILSPSMRNNLLFIDGDKIGFLLQKSHN